MVPLIQVFDMPTSIHFYRDQLGFELVQSNTRGDTCDRCMLRFAGIVLMLNTQYEAHERPAAQDPVRRAHHDTALYFGCPDVDAGYAQLCAAGLPVKPPYITGYGFKAVDLKDPDGFHLCFQWPAEQPHKETT
jgi:catechol 2,3-dioxygenase-like lactoylglutathione lyase family enzyme